MSFKTGKEETYFCFFQKLYKTWELDPNNFPQITNKKESIFAANRKSAEFNNYINNFLNKQLTKNNS